MSKLLELIKLVPRALKNPEAILEGWINDVKLHHGNLPDDEIAEIIRRRSICEGCPFLSSNAVANELHYKTDRTDNHCIMCGCPITKKTASLQSNCGIEYYNEQNPNAQLPLKWTAYTKTN